MAKKGGSKETTKAAGAKKRSFAKSGGGGNPPGSASSASESVALGPLEGSVFDFANLTPEQRQTMLNEVNAFISGAATAGAVVAVAKIPRPKVGDGG